MTEPWTKEELEDLSKIIDQAIKDGFTEKDIPAIIEELRKIRNEF